MNWTEYRKRLESDDSYLKEFQERRRKKREVNLSYTEQVPIVEEESLSFTEPEGEPVYDVEQDGIV